MGNYTAGARTICPYYLKESDKGITCEGVIPATNYTTRFSCALEKRRYQKTHCEMKDYGSKCPMAVLLENRIAGNTVTIAGNTVIAARVVHVGKNIKEAREVLGLTQDQLSRLAHLSRSHLSCIECGADSPSLDVLLELARALGTTAGALVEAQKRRED